MGRRGWGFLLTYRFLDSYIAIIEHQIRHEYSEAVEDDVTQEGPFSHVKRLEQTDGTCRNGGDENTGTCRNNTTTVVSQQLSYGHIGTLMDTHEYKHDARKQQTFC